MTAEDIKAALRARHQAAGGDGGMVGEWTCVEELWGIDLLAWSAWGHGERIGYEVKVSRSDYRREVLNPHKRATAVARCHQFYFAVPDGLLKRDELAYREPGDLRLDHFQRTPCPGWDVGPIPDDGVQPLFGARRPRGDMRPYGGACRKFHRASWYGGDLGERRALLSKHVVKVPVPVVGSIGRGYGDAGAAWIVCPTCGGRGYVAKSRVEQEAPTLWVPKDVGLVVVKVKGGVARTVRKAPIRKPEALGDKAMAEAFRWASVRPDPRHVRAA